MKLLVWCSGWNQSKDKKVPSRDRKYTVGTTPAATSTIPGRGRTNERERERARKIKLILLLCKSGFVVYRLEKRKPDILRTLFVCVCIKKRVNLNGL